MSQMATVNVSGAGSCRSVNISLSDVNLTNLQSNVAFYHVHDFPVRSLTNRCSNDRIGDHWNPFSLNRSSPTYPRVPGSTHDMYEVGDLSAKHGSIAGKNMVDMTFTDFNLPLFGKNSIVGRSVVIHQPNGSRFACMSISYPGEHFKNTPGRPKCCTILICT
uniref:Superoxide dismutase copper/zinc binding domain-containing protein n=1 Tax=Astatotilapia calliptera TaxID=8154 RepID=A0A3P8R6A9_ASTCA